MGNIEASLKNEILSQMDELKKIEVGSEQYEKVVNGVSKLYDKAIEFERIRSDNDLKYDNQEFEMDMKVKQMKNDERDRLIRNILTGLGLVIPAGLTVWGTIKSINFEKTGTLTTIMGRGFIQKLLPKK